MSEPNDELRSRDKKPLTDHQRAVGNAIRDLIQREGIDRGIAFVSVFVCFVALEPFGVPLDKQTDVAQELDDLLARRVRELTGLNRRN